MGLVCWNVLQVIGRTVVLSVVQGINPVLPYVDGLASWRATI